MKSLQNRYHTDGEVNLAPGFKYGLFLVGAMLFGAVCLAVATGHLFTLSAGGYAKPDAFGAVFFIVLLGGFGVFLAYGIVVRLRPSSVHSRRLRVSASGLEMSGLLIPWSAVESIDTYNLPGRVSLKWTLLRLRADVYADNASAARALADNVNLHHFVVLKTAGLNVRHRTLLEFLRWACAEERGARGGYVEINNGSRTFGC
ncbi:hypothetical protein QVA66_10490 [Staphylococcus chromogenes]|nr:hypothetical protein [Staphylococcus chromogenes]